MEIEHRYKGIRSPLKFKVSVFGCIRECVEARGKDFGFIAVDDGWKEAIETPEIRERYTHFVNSQETDSKLEFVELRK